MRKNPLRSSTSILLVNSATNRSTVAASNTFVEGEDLAVAKFNPTTEPIESRTLVAGELVSPPPLVLPPKGFLPFKLHLLELPVAGLPPLILEELAPPSTLPLLAVADLDGDVGDRSEGDGAESLYSHKTNRGSSVSFEGTLIK